MASESAPDQTIGDRMVGYLSQINETYERVEGRVRQYTPSLVRIVEVVLALALLAFLAHWIYWVYITGV